MNNILILGANSDIAAAIAYLFAREKYTVTLASRNIEKLKILQSDLSIKYECDVEIVEFDAQNFASHAIFYQNLKFKPQIVICAFGYLGDQERAQDDWNDSKQILDVNLNGAISILNIIASDMELRGEGTIVGVSSVAGDRGRQSNYIYGCAKAGFSSYLSGLRNRLFKKGVHVLTLKPGFVNTKMIEGLETPGPLTAQPDEVAKAVWKGIHKKKNVVYCKGIWKLIMMIIVVIPEPIFKRMKL